MTRARYFPLIALLPVIGMAGGCHSGADAAADEAKMRAAYEKKNYKLSDVPPEQRAIVESFMKAGKEGKVPIAKPSPTATK